jgi:hypothetical protein
MPMMSHVSATGWLGLCLFVYYVPEYYAEWSPAKGKIFSFGHIRLLWTGTIDKMPCSSAVLLRVAAACARSEIVGCELEIHWISL